MLSVSNNFKELMKLSKKTISAKNLMTKTTENNWKIFRRKLMRFRTTTANKKDWMA